MSGCVRWRPSPQDCVLFVLSCALVVMILEYGNGCVPKERIIQSAENAAAIAQYTALLDTCKEKARAAKDYAVFERCADDVDRMLCTASPLYCPDGGAR